MSERKRTRRKRCPRCGEVKPLDDYYIDRSQPDGHTNWCTPCKYAANKKYRQSAPPTLKESQRKSGLKSKLKRYGISESQYSELLESQSNKCAICKSQLDMFRGTHIDHCHTSSMVRGVLCSGCNTGLGHFKDDPALLAAAIEYLRIE